jgi:hypothetical protein
LAATSTLPPGDIRAHAADGAAPLARQYDPTRIADTQDAVAATSAVARMHATPGGRFINHASSSPT